MVSLSRNIQSTRNGSTSDTTTFSGPLKGNKITQRQMQIHFKGYTVRVRPSVNTFAIIPGWVDKQSFLMFLSLYWCLASRPWAYLSVVKIPLSLLTSIHVSNYNATFSPVHLVFLELEEICQPHLDFKALDENNNEVIPRTFYLQLLNKEWVYTTMKPKSIQI